jgi:hypothetical protein
MVAIQAAAVAAAAVIAMAAIYFGKRSNSAASGRQVEAVGPLVTASAAPAPEPTAAPNPTEPIIGVDFAPSPTVASPTTTSDRNGAGAPPSSTSKTSNKDGFGVARLPVVLMDRNGGVVGKVAKGARVRVVRESGPWTQVIYASPDGLMSMGWAPTSAIGPAP